MSVAWPGDSKPAMRSQEPIQGVFFFVLILRSSMLSRPEQELRNYSMGSQTMHCGIADQVKHQPLHHMSPSAATMSTMLLLAWAWPVSRSDEI